MHQRVKILSQNFKNKQVLIFADLKQAVAGIKESVASPKQAVAGMKECRGPKVGRRVEKICLGDKPPSVENDGATSVKTHVAKTFLVKVAHAVAENDGATLAKTHVAKTILVKVAHPVERTKPPVVENDGAMHVGEISPGRTLLSSLRMMAPPQQ